MLSNLFTVEKETGNADALQILHSKSDFAIKKLINSDIVRASKNCNLFEKNHTSLDFKRVELTMIVLMSEVSPWIYMNYLVVNFYLANVDRCLKFKEKYEVSQSDSELTSILKCIEDHSTDLNMDAARLKDVIQDLLFYFRLEVCTFKKDSSYSERFMPDVKNEVKSEDSDDNQILCQMRFPVLTTESKVNVFGIVGIWQNVSKEDEMLIDEAKPFTTSALGTKFMSAYDNTNSSYIQVHETLCK